MPKDKEDSTPDDRGQLGEKKDRDLLNDSWNKLGEVLGGGSTGSDDTDREANREDGKD